MWPFSKPAEQLTEADLRWLIDNAVRENVSVEYKRQTYDKRDPNARIEMLRDVSSIANAEGGVLILGMDEDGAGVARALVPVPDAEAEGRRIVSSCLASIAERIPGLAARPVTITGGEAIVVIIPRSYRRPHMITADGANELWIRHDRQKSRMSIAEVRTAITAAEEFEMRVQEFIDRRRRSWTAQQGRLLGITGTPLLIEAGRVDVLAADLRRLLRDPPTYRPNGVGVALAYEESRVLPTIRGAAAYTEDAQTLEVYRSGHVDFAALKVESYAEFHDGRKVWVFKGWAVAEYVRNFVHFVRALRALASIADPYVFTLTATAARGFNMPESGRHNIRMGERFNEWTEADHLELEPALAQLDEEPDRTAQRIVDHFWNALNYPRCVFFDGAGRFVIPDR